MTEPYTDAPAASLLPDAAGRCDSGLNRGLVRALRDEIILPADYLAAARACRDCAAPAHCAAAAPASFSARHLPPACCSNAPLLTELAQI